MNIAYETIVLPLNYNCTFCYKLNHKIKTHAKRVKKKFKNNIYTYWFFKMYKILQ